MKKLLLFSLALLFSVAANAQYHNVYKAQKLWSRIYDFDKLDDIVSDYRGLSLDDSDYIYIGGRTVKDSFGNSGWLILRYTPGGQLNRVQVDSFAKNISTFSSQANAVLWDSVKDAISSCGMYSDAITGGGFGIQSTYEIRVNVGKSNSQYLYDWPQGGGPVHYADAINECEDKNGNIFATGFVADSKSHNALTPNLDRSYVLVNFNSDFLNEVTGILCKFIEVPFVVYFDFFHISKELDIIVD